MSNPDSIPSKSKKPSNSAFKQQRLSAWQPILTAGTVLPTFFVIGILFIPVGIGLWYFSENVNEYIVDYTYCKGENGEICAELKNSTSTSLSPIINCTCILNFTLDKGFTGKVYMYYALTNFYQNHRRYVKSRDDSQLWGDVYDASGKPIEPSEECNPFKRDELSGKFIYPCGAIANSMFNDDIKLEYSKKSGENNEKVNLIAKGIAWESDKKFKFQNPKGFPNSNGTGGDAPYDVHQFAKPKNWKKNIWELGDKESGIGVENEDFIVWMRTAALPNFRKLYRIIDSSTPSFRNGMPAGNYTLSIDYNYQVTTFQGTKKIVFSTTSLLGGKNPFLGIAYILVGALCIVLGVVFLFVHINYGKRKGKVKSYPSKQRSSFNAIDKKDRRASRKEKPAAEVEEDSDSIFYYSRAGDQSISKKSKEAGHSLNNSKVSSPNLEISDESDENDKNRRPITSADKSIDKKIKSNSESDSVVSNDKPTTSTSKKRSRSRNKSKDESKHSKPRSRSKSKSKSKSINDESTKSRKTSNKSVGKKSSRASETENST